MTQSIFVPIQFDSKSPALGNSLASSGKDSTFPLGGGAGLHPWSGDPETFGVRPKAIKSLACNN